MMPDACDFSVRWVSSFGCSASIWSKSSSPLLEGALFADAFAPRGAQRRCRNVSAASRSVARAGPLSGP